VKISVTLSVILCAIEPELDLNIGCLQTSIYSIMRNKTNKCLYKYVHLLLCQLHSLVLVSATFTEVSFEDILPRMPNNLQIEVLF